VARPSYDVQIWLIIAVFFLCTEISRECEDLVVTAELTGKQILTRDCHKELCKEWRDWEKSECLCGFQRWNRTCIDQNLTLSNECSTRTVACEGGPCRLEWSNWRSWTACQDQCSPPVKIRKRNCLVNGEVASGPARCLEIGLVNGATEVQPCNQAFCRDWGEWQTTNCSGICGVSGFQAKRRSCRQDGFILPENLPEECSIQSLKCIPICLPTWGDWSQWTLCSQSCSPGIMERSRECLLNGTFTSPPQCNNKSGKERETATCNDGFCQAWSDWTASQCNALCQEEGNQTLSRTCLKPTTFHSELCTTKVALCRGEKSGVMDNLVFLVRLPR